MVLGPFSFPLLCLPPKRPRNAPQRPNRHGSARSVYFGLVVAACAIGWVGAALVVARGAEKGRRGGLGALVPVGFKEATRRRPEIAKAAVAVRLAAPGLATASMYIPLQHGWATAETNSSLRTLGQSCSIDPKNASLSACHFHLVLIGYPKTGSTLLFSYLLFHPQIRTPYRKEPRYFENPNFDQFYRNGIHPSPQFATHAENTRQVNIDATTTTLTSRDFMGCQRLAATLPPTSRFLVTLREPFERSWSFNKMSERRRFAIHLYFARFFSRRPGNFEALVQCILAGAPTCKPEEFVSVYGTQDPSAVKPLTTMVTLLQQEFAVSKPPSIEATTTRECLASDENIIQCLMPGKRLGHITLKAVNLTGPPFYPNSVLLQSWNNALKSRTSAAARKRCNDCPRLDHVRTEINLNECVGCHCECQKKLPTVRSSLYRVALDHCFEYIDKSRFLFIEMDQLQVNPHLVLNRIVEHAGLAAFDFTNITSEMATARYEAQYGDVHGYTAKKFIPNDFRVDNFTYPPGFEERAKAYFASDTPYLRELTGLKLARWPG